MANSTELYCCPSCGSHDVGTVEQNHPDGQFQVYCNECSFSSKAAVSEEQATRNWNNEAIPKVSSKESE